MTTYFVRSVYPTDSTLSSKVDDNQAVIQYQDFPITNIQPHFFSIYRHKNTSRSHQRDAACLATQDRNTTVTQQETRGGRGAAGRLDEWGFSWTPPSNRHFSKPFFFWGLRTTQSAPRSPACKATRKNKTFSHVHVLCQTTFGILKSALTHRSCVM